MYEPGQTQLAGGNVCYRIYTSSDGTASTGGCLSGPVSNGENQRSS